MRSLTVKLTLAFLAVGLIGALLVALIVGLQTRSAFDRFVLDNYQANFVARMGEYFQENGSWDDIGAIVVARPGPRARPELARSSVVLADADGRVVYGGRQYQPNEQLPRYAMEKAVPVEVDGETVGWILFAADPYSAPPADTPESAFLERFRLAVVLSALGATLVALLLGILLARTISRPVRELTVATQRVAQGELGHAVAVRSQDEVGELAQSFNQMSADLARASQLRRQMTADIAHDLRTPLSVILGYTEALSDGKLPGNPEIFEIMHDEASHLKILIDDLRTLSLADAGELSLDRQPTPPLLMLERTAAAHAAEAESKQIRIRVQAADDVPSVDVDPERMAQVLGNLVSNALRYTPADGEISLSADSAADEVHLQVRDTGQGITPEALPNIFERFYRGNAARNIQEGESGLGLAIAKSLVEAHGGRIWVESKLGVGTTFTIALPGSPA
ncbi:MAG: HAMP domain-containing histidine kinase [Caldilineales bacterium]|nr:HAMP domain-containing histidine kinase [Caldilineales bacterium]